MNIEEFKKVNDNLLVIIFNISEQNTFVFIPCNEIEEELEVLIDWGDSTEIQFVNSFDSPNLSHEYFVPGVYTVTVKGHFPNTLFVSKHSYIDEINKLQDDGEFSYIQNRFYNCNVWNYKDAGIDFFKTSITRNTWLNRIRLTSFPDVNLTGVVNLSHAWRDCSSLVEFPLLDTSNVTSICFAWAGCSDLIEFPPLDTSNVVNMEYAWYNCSKIESFPFINTHNTVNMDYAWRNCTGLTTFPNIDTSNVTNMESSWCNCINLTQFPPLNTYFVKDLTRTWQSCVLLSSFPSLNVINVETMYRSWRGCVSLVSFPFLQNVKNCKSFEEAWSNCRLLEHFPADMFNELNGKMLYNCFKNTWEHCDLSTQSVENILVSINNADITPYDNDPDSKSNRISIGMRSDSALTDHTLTAISNLKNKKWNIAINRIVQ